MTVPAREIALYAHLSGAKDGSVPCTSERDTFRNDLMTLLSEYTDSHPSTMYSLLALGENLSKSCGSSEIYFLTKELSEQGCCTADQGLVGADF